MIFYVARKRDRRWVGVPKVLADFEAVEALRLVDDRDTARRVAVTALYHNAADVREEAIYVLGNQFRSVRQVGPVLCRIVADSQRSGHERGLAADALAKLVFVGRSATTALLRALSDGEIETRWWAAFALGVVGDLRALGPLKAATNDESVLEGWWSVGKEAQDALESFRSPQLKQQRRARRRY